MFFYNRIRNIFSSILSPTSTLNKVAIPMNNTKHSLKDGYIFIVPTIDRMDMNETGKANLSSFPAFVEITRMR